MRKAPNASIARARSSATVHIAPRRVRPAADEACKPPPAIAGRNELTEAGNSPLHYAGRRARLRSKCVAGENIMIPKQTTPEADGRTMTARPRQLVCRMRLVRAECIPRHKRGFPNCPPETAAAKPAQTHASNRLTARHSCTENAFAGGRHR